MVALPWFNHIVNRGFTQCWERSLIKWFQIRITPQESDLKSQSKITHLKVIWNQNHLYKKIKIKITRT